MMMKITMIIFCCLAGLIGVVSCEYDQNRMYLVPQEMQEFNEILADKVTTTDPEENFKFARDLLAEYGKDKRVDKSKLSAVELFLALSTINDGNICSERTNTIFQNIANNSTPTKAGPLKCLRRVDRISANYYDRWLKKCVSSYPRILKEILAKMDPVKLMYLDTMFDEAIHSNENKIDKRSEGKSLAFRLMQIATGFTWVKESRSREYVVRKIYEIAQKDPRAKSEEDRKLFTEDQRLGEYVFKESKFFQYYDEPCRYYIQQLGNSVFEPVLLIYRKNKQLLFEDDPEFYRAWAKYYFCQSNKDAIRSDRIMAAVMGGEIDLSFIQF